MGSLWELGLYAGSNKALFAAIERWRAAHPNDRRLSHVFRIPYQSASSCYTPLSRSPSASMLTLDSPLELDASLLDYGSVVTKSIPLDFDFKLPLPPLSPHSFRAGQIPA